MHITSSHTCTHKPLSGFSKDAPFFPLAEWSLWKKTYKLLVNIHNINPSPKLCGHYQIILTYWSWLIYLTYPNLNIRFNPVYMTIWLKHTCHNYAFCKKNSLEYTNLFFQHEWHASRVFPLCFPLVFPSCFPSTSATTHFSTVSGLYNHSMYKFWHVSC